jgi:hypothetical protein
MKKRKYLETAARVRKVLYQQGYEDQIELVKENQQFRLHHVVSFADDVPLRPLYKLSELDLIKACEQLWLTRAELKVLSIRIMERVLTHSNSIERATAALRFQVVIDEARLAVEWRRRHQHTLKLIERHPK